MGSKLFRADLKEAKKYFEDDLNLSTIRYSYPEILEDYRYEYLRDRDRILYSTAFRRLSGKTQVFIAGYDFLTRTRLTHTLEVNQISNTITKALDLNCDLSEAISLGHDIGHAPFGHVGEHILNCIMNNCFKCEDFGIKLKNKERGFKHNFQSIRILNELELNKEGLSGLNLTYFTLWGILNHTKIKNKQCEKWISEKYCSILGHGQICKNKGDTSLGFYDDYIKSKGIENAWSLEGLIVKWADEIAQRHHDIEDALIAKIVEPSEINEQLKAIPDIKKTYNKYFKEIENQIKSDKNLNVICSNYSKILVDAYVSKYKEKVKEVLEQIKDKYNINKKSDFWKKRDEIYADDEFDIIKKYEKYFPEDKKINDFLRNKIIHSEDVEIMNSKGIFVISKLFSRYLKDPLTLPDEAIHSIFTNLNNLSDMNYDKSKLMEISKKKIWEKRKILENDFLISKELKFKLNNKENKDDFLKILKRVICDQISYMTDEFALKQFQKLYESESFKNF